MLIFKGIDVIVVSGDNEMLKRKMYDFLLEWKKTKNRECLLIKGARQVGKTFIVQQFAADHYAPENYYELNFLFHPELISIFSSDLDVDEIMLRMSVHFEGKTCIPGTTLIFLDEIQKCPQARTALKAFALDNRYDVIASGSLLGLHYGQDEELEEEISSIPVGYERSVKMFPLDFEEFLWSRQTPTAIIDRIRTHFTEHTMVPEDINDLLMNRLREYIVVGGMPKPVQVFVETKNYSEVQKEQEKILISYADDIVRHAPKNEKQKVKKAFDSIPRQLAKENRKFQYSLVEQRSNARKYESSIQWLFDSNLAYQCSNLSLPEYPLNAYTRPDYFKLYMNDTGLLTAMYGFEMKAAVLERTLKGPVKGGIYENLIACMLMQKGDPLYFYKPDENDQEIEFIISRNAQAVPIEVKAKRGETISLNSFIERRKPAVAYKLIDGNVGKADQKITIPHYMAMFI